MTDLPMNTKRWSLDRKGWAFSKNVRSLCAVSARKAAAAAILIAVALPGLAQAQSSSAGSIPVGDARLTPWVDLEYVTNNNAFLSNSDEQDTSGIILSPSVELKADKGATAFTLAYRGSYSSFEKNALNYTNHSIDLSGAQVFTSRLRLNGSLGVSRNHQELGTNATAGNAANFDEQITFNDFRYGASLTFGASGAKGNVRAGFSARDSSPANFTEQFRVLGFSSFAPFVEFSFRLSPDTRIDTGVEFANIDRDGGTSGDRDTLTAYTGASFAATGKLSGSVRVGISDSDYAVAGVEDTQEVVVRAGLKFRALSYSIYNLSVIRDFDLDTATAASNGQDNFSDRAELRWRHEWSSRFFHEAAAVYSKSSRFCPDAGSPEVVQGSLWLNTVLKRWLILGVGINADQRDGNLCNDGVSDLSVEDYQRQRIGIKLRATL